MKYVWPPLMAAIEARQKEIADGLSSAERAKKDLELAKANATDQLKEAKLQAAKSSIRPTNARPRSLMRPLSEPKLSGENPGSGPCRDRS